MIVASAFGVLFGTTAPVAAEPDTKYIQQGKAAERAVSAWSAILRFSPIVLDPPALSYRPDDPDLEEALRRAGRPIDMAAGVALTALYREPTRERPHRVFELRHAEWHGVFTVGADGEVLGGSLNHQVADGAPDMDGTERPLLAFAPSRREPRVPVIPQPELDELFSPAIVAVDYIPDSKAARAWRTPAEVDERALDPAPPSAPSLASEDTDEPATSDDVPLGATDDPDTFIVPADEVDALLDATTEAIEAMEEVIDETTAKDTAETVAVGPTPIPAETLDDTQDETQDATQTPPPSDFEKATATPPPVSRTETPSVAATDWSENPHDDIDWNLYDPEPLPTVCNPVLQPPSLRKSVNAYLNCLNAGIRIAPHRRGEPVDWEFHEPINLDGYPLEVWTQALRQRFNMRFEATLE